MHLLGHRRWIQWRCEISACIMAPLVIMLTNLITNYRAKAKTKTLNIHPWKNQHLNWLWHSKRCAPIKTILLPIFELHLSFDFWFVELIILGFLKTTFPCVRRHSSELKKNSVQWLAEREQRRNLIVMNIFNQHICSISSMTKTSTTSHSVNWIHWVKNTNKKCVNERVVYAKWEDPWVEGWRIAKRKHYSIKP